AACHAQRVRHERPPLRGPAGTGRGGRGQRGDASDRRERTGGPGPYQWQRHGDRRGRFTAQRPAAAPCAGPAARWSADAAACSVQHGRSTGPRSIDGTPSPRPAAEHRGQLSDQRGMRWATLIPAALLSATLHAQWPVLPADSAVDLTTRWNHWIHAEDALDLHSGTIDNGLAMGLWQGGMLDRDLRARQSARMDDRNAAG